MQGIVNGKGTVSVVVLCEQLPAFAGLTASPQVEPGLFNFVIGLVTRINRPTHTVKFEDERPGVHITVIHGGASTFTAKVILSRIVLSAPENNDGVMSLPFPVQRKR